MRRRRKTVKNRRLLISSDVHLCRFNWYGPTSEERLCKMAGDMSAHFEKRPFGKIVFLGDYSLDFWGCNEGGSVINEGKSNTGRFIKTIVPKLPVDCYMMPGNHEQYGNENFKRLVGHDREDAFVYGGYLFVMCDNFSGLLDPKVHSDGVYTPTNIGFVKKQLEENKDLPVILCAHFFDLSAEPAGFFELLNDEKRITALFCGHDHHAKVTRIALKDGDVPLCTVGNYSYDRDGESPYELMWGFTDVTLCDDGIKTVYIEPEADIVIENKHYHHEYREQNVNFFKRRDT